MLRETVYRVAGLLFWAGVGLGLLTMLPQDRQPVERPAAAAGASHGEHVAVR